MQLWLASSDLKQIETVMGHGIFAGVITNPHVMAESNMKPTDLFKELVQLAPAAWYQLRDSDKSTMIAEAETMLAINPQRMRIKVPATAPGLGVIRELADRGLDVMATCVPTAAWLCFALAAGARRIAPYGGMLQKRGLSSKADEVMQMQHIIDQQNADAVICTGIYDVTELPTYAAAGVQTFFIWGRDIEKFLDQPLVDEAVANFKGDWEKVEEGY
jgi:transaldolase